MRKLAALAVTAVALVGLFAGGAFAQSAKFTAQVKDTTIVSSTGAFGPATILSTTIKTPNKKDLLLGVSLQTSLFTLTRVKSKKGQSDTETADVALKITVEIDGGAGNQPSPAEVIFDRRLQTLTAVLGGIIGTCEDIGTFTFTPPDTCTETLDAGNPILDGKITVACECDITDEEIELILDTTAAHHFNFVAANLSPGVHTIDVKAEIVSSTTTDAQATAIIGPGSLTVEEVRATNSPDGIDLQ